MKRERERKTDRDDLGGRRRVIKRRPRKRQNGEGGERRTKRAGERERETQLERPSERQAV